MGKGANGNKLCRCGSGKKTKNCNCKYSILDQCFPDPIYKAPNGNIFHPLVMIDGNEYAEFEMGKGREYAPLYNKEERRLILNPQNAYDILLKKQADSVIENMRIKRSVYKKYNSSRQWNSNMIFDNDDLIMFCDWVNKDAELHEKLKDIPCGMTYETDPNAHCIKTEYGNIITISSELSYFMYYIYLFYMGFTTSVVPQDVASAALTIAIRIMLRNESLDFELDPRGDVPTILDHDLKLLTRYSMFFVFAHECAHHLLGHNDDSNVIQGWDNYTYYNPMQMQEFEADLKAIEILKRFIDEEKVIIGAVYFFLGCDLYQQAVDQISPSFGRLKTHPEAIARIRNMFERYSPERFEIDAIIERNEKIKNALMDDISTDFDKYEFYGSIYLGQWHKKDLVDRIDY